MTEWFEVRQCENNKCRLRYPLIKGQQFGDRCPVCLGSTISILAQELSKEPASSRMEPPLLFEVLVDNVRSAWNVGAIFRTADGLGVQKLYLCGITPTPENKTVSKTALGAESSVPWVYSPNALELALELKLSGNRLWALEQDNRATSIYSPFFIDSARVVLILGNEITGVDPSLLDICDRIVSIPMYGKKRSLNVEVAFAAAVSALLSAALSQSG